MLFKEAYDVRVRKRRRYSTTRVKVEDFAVHNKAEGSAVVDGADSQKDGGQHLIELVSTVRGRRSLINVEYLVRLLNSLTV